MTRTWTPDEKTETGRIIHVKRACNGCQRLIGDVTEEELDCVIAGQSLPDVRAECGCDRLDAIRERAQAATPGPWSWHGNADFPQSISLESREWVVLANHGVPRSVDDEQAKSYLDNLDECEGWLPDEEEAAREARLRDQVVDDYVTDAWGNAIEDQRLFMRVPVKDHIEQLRLEPLHEHVVFEVCRDATERSDKRVYRADFTETRSPDAQFMAHSRSDVDWLLAEVDRLRAVLAESKAGA